MCRCDYNIIITYFGRGGLYIIYRRLRGRVRKFGTKKILKKCFACIIGSHRRLPPGRGTRPLLIGGRARSGRRKLAQHTIQVWQRQRRRERSTGRQVRGSRRRGIDAHFSRAHAARAVGARGGVGDGPKSRPAGDQYFGHIAARRRRATLYT